LFIQIEHDFALGTNPLWQLESERPWYVRVRVGDVVVEDVSTATFAEHKDIWMALGD
jgi:hypothetical protein